ncbi:M28 family peptidase [Clostridium luticellarii]|uniref:M28 family peptidase n=2 Tax=Clostridium luticellarii TaxID=1691940 RepID=UPI002353A3A6|nr:M28 family peptidase [Clostridium luticellarii]MCI1969597.1 M28 family peptidase [Clostridium luticellarii]
MKNKCIKLILIFTLISCYVFSGCTSLSFNNKNQSTVANNVTRESNQKLMMNTIKSLAANNRTFGSDNEKKAYEYIENKIQSYGYKTQTQTFSFYNRTSDNKLQLKSSQNLIVIKRSKANYNKEAVIICAHYDCFENSVGANDNASGVSVVMETARLLKNVPSNYELRFIFFGGEELGGVGSNHYIKNLSSNDKKNIKAVINIDSIAQKGGSKPYIFTISGKKNFAVTLLERKPKDMNIKKTDREFSDYVAFDANKIPALCIGQAYDKNLKINSPQDTISLIDESKLKLVADTVINSLSN